MTPQFEQGAPRRAAGALVPTMRARWAAMGPMDIEIGPSDFRMVAQHMTIGALAPTGAVVCCINGEWISRRDWWQPVREGDVIVFKDTSAILGGENSDVLRVVLTIVVLIVATEFAPALAAELGTSQAIAQGLIMIGGNLLVNAILPNPSQAGGFSAQQAISPTYSIGGAGNAARLGQAIPVRYGQEFFYPDFACQPYAEYDNANSDQYYCAVLSLGYGHYRILQVSIEDTDIRSFQDVQAIFVGPGQQADAPYSFTVIDTAPAGELASQWTVSAALLGATISQVTQEAGEFAGLCYKHRYDEIHDPGEEPYQHRAFPFTTEASLVVVSADVRFTNDASVRQAFLKAGCDASGNGIAVAIFNDTLYIQNSSGWGAYAGTNVADAPIAGGTASGITYRLEVTIRRSPASSLVQAKVFSGTTELASITSPAAAANGNRVGMSEGIPDDSSSYFSTEYKNVSVQATGLVAGGAGFGGVATLAEQSIVETGMVVAPEVSQISLESTDWIGGYACMVSGRQMDRVFFDFVFPEGIGAVQPDGSILGSSVSLQFSARSINDFGQPTSAWQLLGNITESAASRQPIRRSYGYMFAPGRYQGRVRRVLDVSTNAYVYDDAVWVGLRSRLTIPGVQRDDCTYVVVRMRANEQLSGLSQRRIGVLAQRLIPIYDVATQTWSEPTFTRNPAHVFADILHDDVEGRGLPDSRIDHDTLADLASVYAARQDHFDYSFDTRRTFDEALQLVARAGRARPLLRRGSVYTMVRDEQQASPVAMFMPRNMQADSFSMRFRLANEDSPDCVRMEFRNGATWTTDYVYAQIVGDSVIGYGTASDGVPIRPAGVPVPQRVQEERLSGVVGRTQALREAMFLVADAIYRPISCDWKTELDGLLPTIGSLVGIAHDVAAWGQSGDVVQWTPGTLTIETTEPLSWAAGQTHYVRLQTSAGGAGPAIAVTPGGDAYTMVLASAPEEAPVFDSVDRERTRYLFGSLADVTRYVRIKRISPESQYDIALAAVLEDNRVHAIDAPLLPAAGQVQDPLSDGSYTSVPGDGGTGPGGGSTGAGIPVSLYGESWSTTRLGGPRTLFNDLINLGFGNDGMFYLENPIMEGPTQVRWLSLAPVSPPIASLFEIMFEDLGATYGSAALVSPPTNAWLNLGTSRSVHVSGMAVEDPAILIPRADGSLRVTIRDAATQVIQASAVFNYSLRVVSFF